MQVLFFIFSKIFPSPARESSPGISRGCSLPVTQERAQAMVRVLAAAAAVVAAVTAAIIPATTVVAAATAAATPAVIPTAAVRTTAAAEDDDQDQNDPQAAVTTPTVVTTHRQLPPVRDGDRLAISVHLMPQVPGCAPRLGAFFYFLTWHLPAVSRCSATRFLRNRDRIVEKKSPILRSISEARSLASTAPQQGERPTQEGGLF